MGHYYNSIKNIRKMFVCLLWCFYVTGGDRKMTVVTPVKPNNVPSNPVSIKNCTTPVTKNKGLAICILSLKIEKKFKNYLDTELILETKNSSTCFSTCSIKYKLSKKNIFWVRNRLFDLHRNVFASKIGIWLFGKVFG